MKPPFIQIPAYVDGEALFAAAYRLEAKLTEQLPQITRALTGIESDYTGSVITRPNVPPDYWATWFAKKVPNVLSYLQIYAYIIAQALPHGPLSEVRMLDYGAGWGLLGLLAKEAGVGSVTYLDIHPGTTAAVQVIASTIGLPLDGYICGDENALAGRPERFNSVVSSDCLEHVYRPRRVFERIAEVTTPGALVFHHTGANPYSPHQRYTLSRLHRTEEPALRALREDVIRASGINGTDAPRLAAATRGLDRADLQAAIERFQRGQAVPEPDHPTNTCDLTGYWLERLMDPYDVARQMMACGYRASVRQSYWGPGRSSVPVRAVKHTLNLVSRASLTAGLRATFYYGIHGVRC